MQVRAAAGIALARILGIEHVLARLLVHHLTPDQLTGQVVDRHPQLLRYLRRGVAAHRLEHQGVETALVDDDCQTLVVRTTALN